MNTEYFFSIIVPVYNIEGYLEQCILSLLSQKGNQDYEVILVDDGSTDGSALICDSYAARYELIKCFHKHNGGLSDARNYGVDRATGKYLLFIDGDDYISSDALDNCRVCISKADEAKVQLDVIIAEGQYFDYESKISYEKWFDIGDIKEHSSFASGEDILSYTLPRHCNWAAWGKFYRRDFWIDNGYHFIKDRFYEDMQLTDKVVLEAGYVSIVPAFVYYRYRESSIVHSISYKKIESIIDNLSDWESYFESNIVRIDIEKQIKKYLSGNYLHVAVANVYNIESDEIESALSIVRDKSIWLDYVDDIEGKLVKICYNLLGLRLTCKILSMIKRRRLEKMK